MQLDEAQLEAVRRCTDVKDRVVPVTGQAGTGKTTIIKQVHAALTEAGYTVAVCAPTGKAAKRIYEATGIPAVTIHRLLEYPMPGEIDPKTGKALSPSIPKRCRKYPLGEDVIICDEYAMVNTSVHRNLFDAMKPGAAIRVFGDANQLEPIEEFQSHKMGDSPFQDLLKKFKGITLKTIHRQSEGSGIVANGDLILKGIVPRRRDDFTMKITDLPVADLQDYLLELLENDISFGTPENQVLSPMKKTWVGTYKINLLLQSIYNPDAKQKGFKVERHKWHDDQPIWIAVGDKVINTKNNYDLECFNGETGIVVDIDEFHNITIDFGDRVVQFPIEIETRIDDHIVYYNPQRELELAYCITTHKAQGSEYKRVVYLMNKSTMFMHDRRNFYTAVTRAREHVHLITDGRSLSTSVLRKTRPEGRRK